MPLDGHPMPKVFVGIPTYNRPLWVQEAVRSVQLQQYTDFRVVVSDNCSSPDASLQVERFIASLGDSRFTFHRQAENGGEYGQGWFFFEQSVGYDFLLILHDDDVLLPYYLQSSVAVLEAEPRAAFYVANSYGMDASGRRSSMLTRRHLRELGRLGARAGLFDVLEEHLTCGFAPISGTLFRRRALERAGFVDIDLTGNYPFEANIFLRLGEAGAQAWFSPCEHIGVRFHRGAPRSKHFLRDRNVMAMRDRNVMANCVRLWERRRFAGHLERRRRMLLSRYRRAQAIIELDAGNFRSAQRYLLEAMRDNPLSVKAWALAPMIMGAPTFLRLLLRWKSLYMILLLVLLLPSCVAEPSPPIPLEPEVFRSTQRYVREYLVQPGDEIEVAVFDAPELGAKVNVRSDGYVSLPILKDVKVAGHTIPELNRELAKRYSSRVKKPDVTVTVLNPRQAYVYVLGEVTHPGPVPLRAAPNLAFALAAVGGTVRTAGLENVALIRLEDDGTLTGRIIPVNQPGETAFYMMMAATQLKDNDLVVVPESSRSNFVRFVQDFISTPASGANQALSPYFQFEMLNLIAKQGATVGIATIPVTH
jgi:polysaccharide export outer membrane protein